MLNLLQEWGVFLRSLVNPRIPLFVLMVVLAWSAPALPSPPRVGEIDMASGVVLLQSPGQAAASPVTAGTSIFQGDTLMTGDNGYTYIFTTDQAFISVRPNSRLLVEKYSVGSGNSEQVEIRFELQKGVARFISGQAVSKAKQRFRLNTPIAAIGVRGTDFTVFTDALVTRASVNSGRIAVSPFAADCLASGLGPCSGNTSVELAFGGSFPVIELSRGDMKPRLLPTNSMSPDRVAPPGPNEPLTIIKKGENGGEPANDSSLTSPGSKAVASAVTQARSGLDLSVSSQVSRIDEVSSDTRLINPTDLAPPRLEWGRWKPLASLPASDTKRLFDEVGSTEVVATVGAYLLRRESLPVSYQLPASGRYGFVLRDYEAFWVRDGNAAAMKVANPELVIDFGLARFDTRLDLESEKGRYSFRSSGGLSQSGRLMNDPKEQPQTVVRGALAGQGATQAGYLFEAQLPAGEGVLTGATRWAR